MRNMFSSELFFFIQQNKQIFPNTAVFTKYNKQLSKPRQDKLKLGKTGKMRKYLN